MQKSTHQTTSSNLMGENGIINNSGLQMSNSEKSGLESNSELSQKKIVDILGLPDDWKIGENILGIGDGLQQACEIINSVMESSRLNEVELTAVDPDLDRDGVTMICTNMDVVKKFLRVNNMISKNGEKLTGTLIISETDWTRNFK